MCECVTVYARIDMLEHSNIHGAVCVMMRGLGLILQFVTSVPVEYTQKQSERETGGRKSLVYSSIPKESD